MTARHERQSRPTTGDITQVDFAPGDMREYAVFALDAQGHVTTWSTRAEHIKGYRSDEIIGRHLSVFYPEDRASSGYPNWELEQAAENGVFVDRGWRVRKDGSRFWAHVVITAQRDTDGTLDGFIKITRDESEAQQQRQRSNRRFTDLFELAPVGLALLDSSDRVLDANSALCALVGRRLHGVVATELLHPSDPGGGLVPRHGRKADAAERHRRVLTGAAGEPVHCDVHCAASVHDDGEPFWLAMFQDVTEQVQRAEALHHRATHDETTGLLNRQGATELLERELRDGGRELAVLFCDLDNFKRINDSLGHDAGDELLAVLAQRLIAALPASCAAARLYGDEFLVVCPDVRACGGVGQLTAKVAEVLRAVIPLYGRLVSVNASIGAATAEGRATARELIQAADAAMFVAKKGHGRTSRNGPPVPAAQLSLEEELRDALACGGLELRYQPILAEDRSITMAEALVRWPHPIRGLLSPATILPVAERGGLLPELDRWVLRTALREATGWHAAGWQVAVTVNVAGLRPDDPCFAEEISAAIADSGIDPRRVVLEMVETMLVDLPSKPRAVMRDLARTGVRFAMDDFGTGYSSLARLRDLPTQIVKLDRRFVSGVGTDPADLGITRAVAELARSMGRICVAEGVENTTQFSLLHHLGIDAYQGFLFSKPLPAAEFRALLGESPLPVPAA
ncbi:EAL domain-containing protein [Saccharopolyspora thermophila]|nr:EAL domain-containing protein [Saccharopolyspora subtropica]